MNCPLCLELNIISKIVFFSGIRCCENESCPFCETDDSNTNLTKNIRFLLPSENEPQNTKEYFKMDFNVKLPLLPLNYSNPSLDTSTIGKEIVPLQMYKNIYIGNCPLCFQSNVISKIIHMIGSYVCENKSCIFLETEESYVARLSAKIKEFEKENSSISSSENMSLGENNSTDYNYSKIIENIEIIDLSDELNNFSQFENKYKELPMIGNMNEKKPIKTMKRIRISNNSKLSIIDQSVAVGLDASFYQSSNNNKIFNWLRMPYYMKTHSKIVRILLLHLDVFKFKDNSLIDEIKREYSVCETLANQFRIETVKPLCYQFLNNLYGIIDRIPNHNLICKEMDERVMDLLHRLFDKYDSKGTLKQEYTIEYSCPFCGDNGSVTSKQYILSFKKNRFRMKINENELIHDVNCLKCKNVSKETISFRKVPEFVILHYPKGLREDIGKYENKFVTDDSRKLSIVGIVECGSKYPFSDVLENEMSFETYKINEVTMDNRYRPSYSVHFRNQNGWYSLNGYKQFLCNSQETLPAFENSDVRFVIFGIVADHQLYRHRFSLQGFSDSHQEFAKEKIIEISAKSLNIQNEPVIDKIINKKSNRKPRIKRNLKSCLRTEENIKQLPQLNNLENGKENKIVEEIASAHTQLVRYTLSHSPLQFAADFNYHVSNIHNGNTSSGESSISSLLESDSLRFPKKRKISDLRSQSTSSFSSNLSPVQSRSATHNAMFCIDSLISKTSKKIRQTLK